MQASELLSPPPAIAGRMSVMRRASLNQDAMASLVQFQAEEGRERTLQASSIDILHGCVNTRPSTVRRCVADDIVLLLLCSKRDVVVVSEQDMVLLQILSGHTSDVVAVAFGSPPSHNKTIVSADCGRVMIWSLRDSSGTGETSDFISGQWVPWLSFKWSNIESIVCPPMAFSILFTDTDALHEVIVPQELPPGDPLNWELRPSVDIAGTKKRVSIAPAVDDAPEDRGPLNVILSGAFDFLTVSPDGNVVALRNRPTPNGISGSVMVVGLKRYAGAQPAIAHHDGLSVTSYDWNRSPVYASSNINLLLSSTESGDVFVWLVETGTQRSMNPKDPRLRPVITVTSIAVLEVHSGLPCFGMWLLDEKEAHNTLLHYQNLSPSLAEAAPLETDSDVSPADCGCVNRLPPADDPIMNQWIVTVCSDGDVALVQLSGINHKHLLRGEAQVCPAVVARGNLGRFACSRPRLFSSARFAPIGHETRPIALHLTAVGQGLAPHGEAGAAVLELAVGHSNLSDGTITVAHSRHAPCVDTQGAELIPHLDLPVFALFNSKGFVSVWLRRSFQVVIHFVGEVKGKCLLARWDETYNAGSADCAFLWVLFKGKGDYSISVYRVSGLSGDRDTSFDVAATCNLVDAIAADLQRSPEDIENITVSNLHATPRSSRALLPFSIGPVGFISAIELCSTATPEPIYSMQIVHTMRVQTRVSAMCVVELPDGSWRAVVLCHQGSDGISSWLTVVLKQDGMKANLVMVTCGKLQEQHPTVARLQACKPSRMIAIDDGGNVYAVSLGDDEQLVFEGPFQALANTVYISALLHGDGATDLIIGNNRQEVMLLQSPLPVSDHLALQARSQHHTLASNFHFSTWDHDGCIVMVSESRVRMAILPPKIGCDELAAVSRLNRPPPPARGVLTTLLVTLGADQLLIWLQNILHDIQDGLPASFPPSYGDVWGGRLQMGGIPSSHYQLQSNGNVGIAQPNFDKDSPKFLGDDRSPTSSLQRTRSSSLSADTIFEMDERTRNQYTRAVEREKQWLQNSREALYHPDFSSAKSFMDGDVPLVVSQADSEQLVAWCNAAACVTNDSVFRSLDMPGRMAVLLFDHPRLAMLCAFYSDAQEILIALLGEASIPSLWLDKLPKLKERVEKNAVELFRSAKAQGATDSTPVLEVAMHYMMLGKRSALVALFRQARDEPRANLFSIDYASVSPGDPRLEKVFKNAFACLTKHKYEIAVALFILGGSFEEAVNICLQKLNSVGLACAALRLLVPEDHPDFRRIMCRNIIEFAIESKDRLLLSACWTRLGELSLAITALWDRNAFSFDIHSFLSEAENPPPPISATPAVSAWDSGNVDLTFMFGDMGMTSGDTDSVESGAIKSAPVLPSYKDSFCDAAEINADIDTHVPLMDSLIRASLRFRLWEQRHKGVHIPPLLVNKAWGFIIDAIAASGDGHSLLEIARVKGFELQATQARTACASISASALGFCPVGALRPAVHRIVQFVRLNAIAFKFSHLSVLSGMVASCLRNHRLRAAYEVAQCAELSTEFIFMICGDIVSFLDRVVSKSCDIWLLPSRDLHYLVERAHLLREALAPQSSARQHIPDVKTIAVIVKFVSFLCAFVNKDAQLLSDILKNKKGAKPDAWLMHAIDSECDFVLPEDEMERPTSGGDALSNDVALLHRRLLFSACLMVRFLYASFAPAVAVTASYHVSVSTVLSSFVTLVAFLQHFTLVLRKFSPEKRTDGKAGQHPAHDPMARRMSRDEGPGRGAGHQKAMRSSNNGAGGLFSPARLSRGPSLEPVSNAQEKRGIALFGQLLACCEHWDGICTATIKAHAWHIVLIRGGFSLYRTAMFDNNEDMLRIWREYQGPEKFYVLVMQALNVSPEETGLSPATLVSGLKLYHERSLRIQSMGVLGAEGDLLRYISQLKVEVVSFTCSGAVLPMKGVCCPPVACVLFMVSF